MLTVVLLDVRGLEILWVLDVVESPAQGLEAVGVVCKLSSASCIDDVPCVHNEISYLFPVVPAVIVVAVWLRPGAWFTGGWPPLGRWLLAASWSS